MKNFFYVLLISQISFATTHVHAGVCESEGIGVVTLQAIVDSVHSYDDFKVSRNKFFEIISSREDIKFFPGRSSNNQGIIELSIEQSNIDYIALSASFNIKYNKRVREIKKVLDNLVQQNFQETIELTLSAQPIPECP